MKEVSCIIPVRDRKEMVLKAVESVLYQADADIEIIVVDDGSRDGSGREVKRHFPQVRLLKTSTTLGPGPARNLGARAASGRVLMFLDSDDTWLENHSRLLLQVMKDSGYPAAYGIAENFNRTGGPVFYIPEQADAPTGYVFEELLRWCFLVPSAFAVSKKAFFFAGGFDRGILGEDWLFFLKLAGNVPFAFVPEIITLRNLHRGSLCCRAFSASRAAALVNMLKQEAQKAQCSREMITRLENMLHITEKDGKKCRNVQEWYMILKGQGLA